MACTSVQSTNIGAAASVYGKSRTSKQQGVANVRMLCNSTVQMRGGLRISGSAPSLSMGEGFNAVDTFHCKVARSIAAPCGRGSRCVARAMSSSSDSERLTDKGIKVIRLAHQEARRMGHNYVGTEQILLGLIAEGTGIAAKVFKSMGISLKDARAEVDKIMGRVNGFVAVEEIQYLRVLEHTPEERRVFEHIHEEARELGHNYIDSEHLLLGLLREDECVAFRVLENLGADPNNIRTQVIHMIGETA